MKHLKLYEQFVNESATSDLYHFTYSSKVENILKTNKLYLTSNIGSPSDKLGSKDYYMSFTRTKSNKKGYGASYQNPGSVRLNMDGRKLNQRHKFVTVDYWQSPRDVKTMINSNTDEMEERLVSNNNEIDNANKYIKSIDIYEEDGIVSKVIIDESNRLGIKLNVFDNKRDFSSARSERTVEPKEKVEVEDGYSSNHSDIWSFVELIGALSYNREDKDMIISSASKIEEIKNFEEQIKKYHDKLDYNLRPNDNYSLTDLSSSLSATVQNSQRSPSKMLRYAIKELSNDFRKTNSKSVKEYLNNKIYIGKKQQSDYNKELNDGVIKVIDDSNKTNSERFPDYIYGVDGESEYRGLINFPKYKEFHDSKVKELKQYVSDYLLTNDDMFRYSYIISDSEIRNVLDINVDNKEVVSISEQLENTDPYDVIDILTRIIWSVDDYLSDEIDRVKDEEQQQWKK